MSLLSDEQIAKLFPLKSISDVVQLFRVHLENAREPDLTFLSIVTGMIENTLTRKCLTTNTPNSDGISTDLATPTIQASPIGDIDVDQMSKNANENASSNVNNFPVVQFETVQQLYDKFVKIISLVGECKRVGETKVTKSGRVSASNKTFATRDIIKHCSDVIWNSLIRSTYKDRAHLQSLYSYLAGNKLDCFGVALAVVAGCQLLGYADAHLAISEDHAWVVFGKTGEETIEVTWHGKGAEDKRGQSVIQGYESHSWLYLSGNPVVCDRYMEVAAVVSSINPSLSMTSTCLEVADLQQQLLWLLYDMNHLQRYPMGLGCLGELEEVAPTDGRSTCADLYRESVDAAQKHYKNHHVYPYTYQGSHYYRQLQYKEAFASWANAGDVIRLYNYSRDDEEIYKEFLDIANELIPHVMKTESSGHSAKSVLRDPQCFANLLRFYDGICRWEEGSQTPILHIGWAKPLVTTISRFDGDIRSQVIIHCAHDDDDVNGNTGRPESNNNNDGTPNQQDGSDGDKSTKNGSELSHEIETPETVRTHLVEALTAACGEKILNPIFLLQGDGQPFADQQYDLKNDKNSCAKNDEKFMLLTQSTQSNTEDTNTITNTNTNTNSNEAIASTGDDELKVNVESSVGKSTDATSSNSDEKSMDDVVNAVPTTGPVYKEAIIDDALIPKRPEITLYSQKMKGLKDLLLAEKLNTHAISLQVTAQSQVQVGGKKSRHSVGHVNYATTNKRSRRE